MGVQHCNVLLRGGSQDKCAAKLRAALLDVEGVESALVSFATGAHTHVRTVHPSETCG